MEALRCSKKSRSGSLSRLSLLLAFGSALGSSPAWADSLEPLFVPSAKYELTGAELNRLNEDLQTAKQALKNSETLNEQLAKDSENKQKVLERLQAQLTTVSKSFKKSQDEALSREILVGMACAIIGASAMATWTASN